jgi:general secretion pathway protein G
MTLLPHPPLPRRAGFTLIELMVVIAIIIVLVALLLVGINYAYVRAKVTTANSDIQQLDAAMKAFKAKYGVYPPDQIRLYSYLSDYQNDIAGKYKWSNPALARRSLAFLNRMWPALGNFGSTAVSGTNPPIAWNGIGPFTAATASPVGYEDLDGDQCLVFFLGGIPSPAAGGGPPWAQPLGFSVNPQDPSMMVNQPAANVGTVAAFYSFPTDRLLPLTGRTTNFPSYMDAFFQQPPQPYLYFSANNVKNGYNAYYPTSFTYQWPQNVTAPPYTVQAYYQVAPTATSRGQYWNPETFQIICAGLDGIFGSGGGVWTPANAETFYVGPGGADDQANFYSANLGVSQ